MKFTNLLVLGLLSFTAGVSAEEGGDAATETVKTTIPDDIEPIASMEIDLQAATRAKSEKRKQAKQKKRSMQSCLTLVRSYYSEKDSYISTFLDEHPTKDKNRLLSKILAQMMIKCSAAINNEQAQYLQ